MKLPSFLTGQCWKYATGAAAVVALILSSLLLASYFQNRGLETEKEKLAQLINDPKTGYIAQLAQARTNVAQLQRAVETQNAAIERLSAEGKARLAESERRLAAAQAQTKQMEKKLAGFLATKPQGDTLEDRIQDIDARAMKEFVE